MRRTTSLSTAAAPFFLFGFSSSLEESSSESDSESDDCGAFFPCKGRIISSRRSRPADVTWHQRITYIGSWGRLLDGSRRRLGLGGSSILILLLKIPEPRNGI
jgi:hypothetical protein